MSASHRFHRDLNNIPPMAATAKGINIVDTTGRTWIDAIGGAAVATVGHSNDRVKQAMADQLDKVNYVHGFYFTNQPAETLAEKLVSRSGGKFSKVYVGPTGSDCIEAAIKLTRQYWVEAGQPERTKIISRWHSYHGGTITTLSVSGGAGKRWLFEPLFGPSAHVDPVYAWRHQRPDETEREYGRRIADQLEEEILRQGPETVMCFLAEPVVGSSLGTVPPAEGYFERIREICDKYDILLIADEVMCGSGRTGDLYASDTVGMRPDLLVTAKGLSGGYFPIGVVMISPRVDEVMTRNSGAFVHGYTHEASPTGCTVASTILDIIEEEDLLTNVVAQGERFDRLMREAIGDHPNVGDIRGLGLFRAIELVADKETKRVFDADFSLAPKLKAASRSRGLLALIEMGWADPSPDNAAGGDIGERIIVAPPFNVDDATIEEIVGILADSVREVLPA